MHLGVLAAGLLIGFLAAFALGAAYQAWTPMWGQAAHPGQWPWGMGRTWGMHGHMAMSGDMDMGMRGHMGTAGGAEGHWTCDMAHHEDEDHDHSPGYMEEMCRRMCKHMEEHMGNHTAMARWMEEHMRDVGHMGRTGTCH